MLQLLTKSLLIGDCSPCFEYLTECLKKGKVEEIIKQGPQLIEIASSAGLVQLVEALCEIVPGYPGDIPMVLEDIESEPLKKLLEPIQLPVIKHHFSEVIFPNYDESIDLLRNDQRLSEIYKETTESFLEEQQAAGEIVTRCANLLESTFHKHIQELCKSKDALKQRAEDLNEKIKPVVQFVNAKEQLRLKLEWSEYRIKRMASTKHDITKGMAYIQHQIAHSYPTRVELTAATQYYELLYRDKIIRYQSTQLADSSNKTHSDYRKLLKYLSKVTNVPACVLDDNLINIYDALENEEYVDFAAARELLQSIDVRKPLFTRKDSVLQNQSIQ